MPSPCSARHVLGATLGAFLALAGCQEPGAAEMSRGNVAASRNQLGEALVAYREAAGALPGSARPRELEGHVLLELRRPAEARAAYEAALALEPDALYVRGSALLAARRYAEAGETFDRLREARPDLAFAAYGLARLAGARDDETEVLTHLRQARERAGERWYPEEVLADPLFERFRRDTGLRAVVGSP